MERKDEIKAECLKCGYTVLESDRLDLTVFCPKCGRPDLVPVQQSKMPV